MEIGFFHPELGYWQAISEPSDETLASYPEGTVLVPLKPGGYFEWVNNEWVAAPQASEAPSEDDARIAKLEALVAQLIKGNTP